MQLVSSAAQLVWGMAEMIKKVMGIITVALIEWRRN
jgi:hypothetical protein